MKMLAIIVCLLFSQSYEYNAKVIYICDGDTIYVHDHTSNEVIKVRLESIDSPERTQRFYQESKEYLNNRLLNKSVKIVYKNTDCYGRQVAQVYLNDTCINTELVKLGYAHYYNDFGDNKEIEAAQRNAIIKKLGVWQYNNSVLPKNFRKYSYKKA